jgi:23S rRNA (uracil1939-C5)-methyltransferase
VLRGLAATLGARLHSLWWNGNPARTNAILGPHWMQVCGPPAVEETIGGARIFFPPGAFGQANLDLADRLVAQVAAWVPDGARLVEYHAGCGSMGLGLAVRSERLVMNEVSSEGLAGLALGVAALPADARGRVSILPGEAATHIAALGDADVVIADPPRKGLEPALLDALCTERPPRVILVSCSLDAFLREAGRLRAAGMALRALQPYVLVPHTEHVEVAALFARA